MVLKEGILEGIWQTPRRQQSVVKKLLQPVIAPTQHCNTYIQRHTSDHTTLEKYHM